MTSSSQKLLCGILQQTDIPIFIYTTEQMEKETSQWCRFYWSCFSVSSKQEPNSFRIHTYRFWRNFKPFSRWKSSNFSQQVISFWIWSLLTRKRMCDVVQWVHTSKVMHCGEMWQKNNLLYSAWKTKVSCVSLRCDKAEEMCCVLYTHCFLCYHCSRGGKTILTIYTKKSPFSFLLPCVTSENCCLTRQYQRSADTLQSR